MRPACAAVWFSNVCRSIRSLTSRYATSNVLALTSIPTENRSIVRPVLLISIRLPDPVPSRASLVDAGSALRASDTPRCSRRGREASLIHKLEASGASAACPGPFLYPEARVLNVQGAPLHTEFTSSAIGLHGRTGRIRDMCRASVVSLSIALLLFACATKEQPSTPTSGAPAASSSGTINGAGATFPYPLYSKWFDAYGKT